jgi:peptidyl-prolyl isomerase D
MVDKLTTRTDGLESIITPTDKCKALFRRGQAKNGLKDHAGAIVDLQKAVELNAEDKLIARELALAQRAIKEKVEKEKKAYSKMFA